MRMTSKIQIIKFPELPGSCVVCFKSANGQTDFLDFGSSLEYYGVIVICEDCSREMLSVLNYVPKQELDDAAEQVRNLVDINRGLVDERDRSRAALDAVLAIRPDLRSDDDRTDGVDSTAVKSATGSGKGKS